MVGVLDLDVAQGFCHRVHQVLRQFQLVRTHLCLSQSGHVFDAAQELRVAHLVEHQCVVLATDEDHVLAVPQDHLADAELAALGQSLGQQGVDLHGHVAVGACKVGCVVHADIDLVDADESLDLDDLRTLDLHLLEVFILDDDVLVRAVFVAFDDVGAPQVVAAAAADLLVADPSVVFLVQLVEVEADARTRIDGVVEPDGYGHHRKPDMSLPKRAHSSVSCL